MTIDVSANSDLAALQQVRASPDYASRLRHDWENDSFDRLFESGLRHSSVLEAGQVASAPESAQQAFDVAIADDTAFAPADTRSFSEQLVQRNAADFNAASSTQIATLSTSSVSTGYGISTAPQPAFSFGGGNSAGDDLLSNVPETANAFVNEVGTNSEHVRPARVALVVGLTAHGVTVRIRNPALNLDTVNALRYAVASELGWVGLSLASFKVNGTEALPLKGQLRSADGVERSVDRAEKLFQIGEGSNG